jgi:hypothetical protein
MDKFVQYRCFILGGKLRGISHYDTLVLSYPICKKTLIDFIHRIMNLLDLYEDFTLDIAVNAFTMFVIEVNSPVYAFAGSAKFTANEVAHILMKDCEGIDYPVFKN